MGCIAKMLHAFSTPYDPVRIYTRMPIPEKVLKPHNPRNDLGHDVSKYKSDPSTFRLLYLRHMDQMRDCPTCSTIRIVVIGLACFGLYSIFS